MLKFVFKLSHYWGINITKGNSRSLIVIEIKGKAVTIISYLYKLIFGFR